MPKKNSQGIVIGTKEEAFWTRVKEECEEELVRSKHKSMIDTELLKIANEKILLEKRK